jgi:EAL domain-containing protein (putative c-di-GMP-specific phosphodiesterase class I)
MSLDHERIAGFEALVRWDQPKRGLVFPTEFISMAEQTELIIPMTRWVIREACRQLKDWQDRIPAFSSVWVSINLSPIYIEKCDFARELSEHIVGLGLNASNLALEITESQLLDNADNILEGLKSLHDTGTKLWIDDFGAGYSSLAYLVNFPIHSLKIDRSFISRLVHDEKSNAIAKSIVSLGKSLGVSVIAEGVETPEQLEYLRNIGCPLRSRLLFRSFLGSKNRRFHLPNQASLERGRAGNNFDQFFGDRGLANAVHVQGQSFYHVSGVVRGGIHRGHASRVFRRGRFQQGAKNLSLDISWQEPGK